MDKEIFERGISGARAHQGKASRSRYFDETLRHPKATVDAPDFIHFPFEEVFDRLDGPLPDAYERTARLATVTRSFLRWLVEGNDLSIVGLRAGMALRFVDSSAVNQALNTMIIRSLAARKGAAKRSRSCSVSR
jgi:hypothetical protein